MRMQLYLMSYLNLNAEIITLYLSSDDIRFDLVFGIFLWIRSIHVIQKLTIELFFDAFGYSVVCIV